MVGQYMRRALLTIILLLLPATSVSYGQTTSRFAKEDFEKLVMGKDKQSVLASIGKPDGTAGSSSTDTEIEIWVYRNLVHNPLTGTTYRSTSVTFTNGIVSRVSFH